MKLLIKLLLFLIIFAILHFSYDIFGFSMLKIFSGTDESVFSHLKMAFWSYFFITLIDYFYSKKRKVEFSFFISLLINNIIPWFIVIIWYIVPAIYGKIHSDFIEILWAFVVLIVVGAGSIIIEKNLVSAKITTITKIFILSFFLISIFFYTYFTFFKPWIDLFENP